MKAPHVINKLSGFVKRAVTAAATAVVMPLALFVAPSPASADTSFAIFTPFPNWAKFGVPQFPILRACSELDLFPGTCFGSDAESLQLPGFGPTFLINLEAPAGVGALDIIVPNARWLFPRFFVGRDAPAVLEPFGSDAIFLFNTRGGLGGGQAHMFLVSNNSDDPLNPDPGFCAALDASNPGICATMPAPVDVSSGIDPTTGGRCPHPPRRRARQRRTSCASRRHFSGKVQSADHA